MNKVGKYALVYALLAGALEGKWLLEALRGVVDVDSTERPPPMSARSASTGWRQYHFWHSGFSGGK
jgi:hypothetical protein